MKILTALYALLATILLSVGSAGAASLDRVGIEVGPGHWVTGVMLLTETGATRITTERMLNGNTPTDPSVVVVAGNSFNPANLVSARRYISANFGEVLPHVGSLNDANGWVTTTRTVSFDGGEQTREVTTRGPGNRDGGGW